MPSERGPEPRPDWVVTSAGAIDTELGVLLERDCRNICDWFTRRGLDRDPDELFASALAEVS